MCLAPTLFPAVVGHQITRTRGLVFLLPPRPLGLGEEKGEEEEAGRVRDKGGGGGGGERGGEKLEMRQGEDGQNIR